MDVIIENHLPLLRSTARLYYCQMIAKNPSARTNISIPDLYQEGYFGLRDAAKYYDQSKGVWSSYAIKCMRRCMHVYYCRNHAAVCRNKKQSVGLTRQNIDDFIPIEEPDLDYEIDIRENVRHFLMYVPQNKHHLFRMYFWEGKTYKEISRATGMPVKTIQWNILTHINRYKKEKRLKGSISYEATVPCATN